MKKGFVLLFVLFVACFAGCSVEGRIGQPRYSEEEAQQVQEEQQSRVVEPVQEN